MSWVSFFKKVLFLLTIFILGDFVLSVILNYGLNKYYGINQDPDILINGSSMAMSGFNRSDIEAMTGKSVASYCHEGVTVTERYQMIKHFFHMNPDGLDLIIYEVNPVIFSGIETAENIHTIFYPYMDDQYIDSFVRSHADIKEYWVHKIIRTKRFDSRLLSTVIRGYLSNFENVKTNEIDINSLRPLIQQKDKVPVRMNDSLVETFEKTMHLIEARGVRVIIVMMPMYHIKLQTFNKIEYEFLCNYFTEFCSNREYLDFLNLNMDSIIHDTKYFADPLHFNVNGQNYITNVLGSYLVDQKPSNQMP